MQGMRHVMQKGTEMRCGFSLSFPPQEQISEDLVGLFVSGRYIVVIN